MKRTDTDVVKSLLDQMKGQSTLAKAKKIVKVLGWRVRQRARGRKKKNVN